MVFIRKSIILLLCVNIFSVSAIGPRKKTTITPANKATVAGVNPARYYSGAQVIENMLRRKAKNSGVQPVPEKEKANLEKLAQQAVKIRQEEQKFLPEELAKKVH